MTRPSMNLQDGFLNQVRKEGSEVKVVLLDGSRLSGYVRGFDNFTVILHSHGMQYLLYKHAIAQLIAKKPPRREDHDPREGGGHLSADSGPKDGKEPKEQRKEAPPFNRIDLSGMKGADKPASGGKPDGN
jgi:host factor-I protein